MLDMWPWLAVCAAVSAAIVYAYKLGVEVGKDKR